MSCGEVLLIMWSSRGMMAFSSYPKIGISYCLRIFSRFLFAGIFICLERYGCCNAFLKPANLSSNSA
jgi:hypothetical protein